MKDPTKGIGVYNQEPGVPLNLKVELTFYDIYKNKIVFDPKKTAILGLKDLINDGNLIARISDYNFIFGTINGSTVDEHEEGIYSKKYNATGQPFVKGAIAVLRGDKIEFSMSGTQTTQTQTGVRQWMSFSSDSPTYTVTPPKYFPLPECTKPKCFDDCIDCSCKENYRCNDPQTEIETLMSRLDDIFNYVCIIRKAKVSELGEIMSYFAFDAWCYTRNLINILFYIYDYYSGNDDEDDGL